MQLASYGAKASTRQASQWLPRTSVRSIHIPRGPPLSAPSGTAQKLISGSRQLFSRFITHLTAPGLRPPLPSHSFTRAAHTTGQAAIRNGLSLPVRVALSRPLGAPSLPRVPALPRSVAQVGLGTARNFHSSRPIFQNLVENVPIAGRAIYEADWDVKMRKEKENMLRAVKKEKKHSNKPKALKTSQPKLTIPHLEQHAEEASSASQDLDQYFKDATPAVVTALFIPLAPTPSARLPLSLEGIEQDRLLPFPELAHIHETHSTHAVRVSSLFTRLDAANVWEKGVRCSAFAHGGQASQGASSTCTILRVEFNGWTEAEVRSVIGESGSGWCVLEERRDDDDNESLFSESVCSHDLEDEDATHSLMFPTLDVSSINTLPLAPQDSSFLSTPSVLESSFDDHDFDMASSVWGSEHSFVDPPSENEYYGFSSSFVGRMSNAGWEDISRSHHSDIPQDRLF